MKRGKKKAWFYSMPFLIIVGLMIVVPLLYLSLIHIYNTVTTLFTEGKAASTIGGPWLVPGIKEAGIDLGIAPMPVLPNGTRCV